MKDFGTGEHVVGINAMSVGQIKICRGNHHALLFVLGDGTVEKSILLLV